MYMCLDSLGVVNWGKKIFRGSTLIDARLGDGTARSERRRRSGKRARWPSYKGRTVVDYCHIAMVAGLS